MSFSSSSSSVELESKDLNYDVAPSQQQQEPLRQFADAEEEDEDVMNGMLSYFEEEDYHEFIAARVAASREGNDGASDQYYYSYDDAVDYGYDDYDDEIWVEEQLALIKDMLKGLIPHICYGWGIWLTAFLVRKYYMTYHVPFMPADIAKQFTKIAKLTL